MITENKLKKLKIKNIYFRFISKFLLRQCYRGMAINPKYEIILIFKSKPYPNKIVINPIPLFIRKNISKFKNLLIYKELAQAIIKSTTPKNPVLFNILEIIFIIKTEQIFQV